MEFMEPGKRLEKRWLFMSAYETMREFHKEIEKEFVEAKFDFQYEIASFLQYYSKKFTLSGLQEITDINQGLLSPLNGRKKPRKTTVGKMENSIHVFAEELSRVHFI